MLPKSPSDGDMTAKRQYHYPNDERDRGTRTKCAIHFFDYYRAKKKSRLREKRVMERERNEEKVKEQGTEDNIRGGTWRGEGV